MAQFDFYKFVTETKATVASRLDAGKKALIKEAEEEEKDDWEKSDDEFSSDEFEKEPSKKDVKAADKQIGSDSDKRTQLAQLTKKKDELIQKLKAGQITIDQYKQMIGTIPQQIKTLTADLAKLTDVSDEEEDSLEEGEDVVEDAPGALMYSNVVRPGDAASFFEKYDDTDLAGPGVEIAIDELIEDYKRLILKDIPQHDQYAARIAVKKLWKSKIDAWKAN